MQNNCEEPLVKQYNLKDFLPSALFTVLKYYGENNSILNYRGIYVN